MNCNSFQQVTKDTVRNRKKVSSTLKEEIYRKILFCEDIKFLCCYQILDLISSIHLQRYILANMMKCRHFLVDAFPRMRETKFMVLPVFQRVLFSGRL